MPDKVVYRSAHPDVLAHWHRTASAEARNAWRDRVEKAIAELGFPGRKFATIDNRRVIGVEHPQGESLPAGWRRHKKLTTAIVPTRSTSQGRKAGALLDDLTAPDPRDDMPGGMPQHSFSAHAFMQPGMERHGDTVYVTWSGEIDAGDGASIDPQVWQRIKLSEYYAAVEAAEANAS